MYTVRFGIPWKHLDIFPDYPTNNYDRNPWNRPATVSGLIRVNMSDGPTAVTSLILVVMQACRLSQH